MAFLSKTLTSSNNQLGDNDIRIIKGLIFNLQGMLQYDMAPQPGLIDLARYDVR